MALKDIWVDLENATPGVAGSGSDVLADDINNIANAVIDIENTIGNKADASTTLSGYGITDAYTKTETDTALNGKADKRDTYTKTEIDALIDTVEIETDTEMSDISENAVQNKVIKAYVDETAERIKYYGDPNITPTSDEYFDFELLEDNSGYSIVIKNKESYPENIVIPYKYNELLVTTIGESAFENCNSLTSVTIPDSVTTIGDYAFCDCDSLTSITIPDSVTTIGSYAFSDCIGLINVTIGDSVITIGSSAFAGSGLTSVTIPDSVTTIGEWAFSLCTTLESITIPYSATTIGNAVFYGCESLTSITIPDSVTTIGKEAFSHCTGLINVTIPESVTFIGNYAFSETAENFTIKGYINSYAENYAKDNNIPFEYIGADVDKEYVDGLVGEKADKSTTLSGYGITDAYTKTEVNDLITGDTPITVETDTEMSDISENAVQNKVIKAYVDEKQPFIVTGKMQWSDGTYNIAEMSATNAELREVYASGKTILIKIDDKDPETLVFSSLELPLILKDGGNNFLFETLLTPANKRVYIISSYDGWSMTYEDIPYANKSELEKQNEIIEKLKYYNDANISPSNVESFTFTVADNTATISNNSLDYDDWWNITDLVLPYKYIDSNNKEYLITEIDSGFWSGLQTRYPSVSNIVIPSTIQIINDNSFRYCNNLTSITISKNVTYIGENVFYGHSKDFIIRGHKGSYAETYANENNITFISISDLVDKEYVDGLVGDIEALLGGI